MVCGEPGPRPTVKGWLSRLIGTRISRANFERAIQGKKKKKPA